MNLSHKPSAALILPFLLLTLLLPHSARAEAKQQSLPALQQAVPAPDFTLQGEDGKTYRLQDYRGKVVIVSFWATWCPPCRYEMPSLERLWQKTKDKGIVVLGVNVGENTDTIFEFTGSYPVSFPLPMDINGSVVKDYPVIGLPTTYVVSPKGMITHRAIGSREWDDPVIIQQLLDMRK